MIKPGEPGTEAAIPTTPSTRLTAAWARVTPDRWLQRQRGPRQRDGDDVPAGRQERQRLFAGAERAPEWRNHGHLTGRALRGDRADLGGTVSVLLPGGHGATRILTDSTGNTQGYYDYDAFGRSISPGEPAITGTAATTEFQYTGLRLDSALGTSNTQTRLYSAPIGRFTSADSYIAEPGDTHNASLYVYVGDNPANLNDPTGNFSIGELITSEGVQNQINALRLPEVSGAFNAATNIKQTVQVFTSLIRGAPFDTVSAILFGLQFLPIGGLLERVGAQFIRGAGGVISEGEGVVTGVESELTELYNSSRGYVGSSVNSVSQLVGETGAAATAKALGLGESSFTTSYHGIDGLLQDSAGNFFVVEAKSASLSLGETGVGQQLGAKWIEARVQAVIDRAVQAGIPESAIRPLQDQLNGKTIRTLLVQTPITNGQVGAPQFWIKTLQDIENNGGKFF